MNHARKQVAPDTIMRGGAEHYGIGGHLLTRVVHCANRYGLFFARSLSSWRLTISASGTLRQKVKFYAPLHPHAAQPPPVKLGGAWVAALLKRAAEVNFWEMTIESDDVITDAPTCTLAIRDGARRRTFRLDAPGYYRAEGYEAATHFLDLWETIHRHAPFPARY